MGRDSRLVGTESSGAQECARQELKRRVENEVRSRHGRLPGMRGTESMAGALDREPRSDLGTAQPREPLAFRDRHRFVIRPVHDEPGNVDAARSPVACLPYQRGDRVIGGASFCRS